MPKWVRGEAKLQIPGREEIARQMRKRRPKRFEALRTAVLKRVSGAGYRRIVIPCFDDVDPEVPIFGQRTRDEDIIVVFGRTGISEWDVRAITLRRGVMSGPGFEEAVAQVMAVQCEEIRPSPPASEIKDGGPRR